MNHYPRKMNSHLTILTKAMEAQLQATVDSAKQFLQPEYLDSLDLIESRYAPMRQSLLSLYQAIDFQPFRRSEPSLQALEYISFADVQTAPRGKPLTVICH